VDAAYFFGMLTLGLVTSLHCISMCGPIVATIALDDTENATFLERLGPQFTYHVARVASYALVGLVLGFVGSFFNFEGIRPYAMFVAGGFMLLLALAMSGLAPWAQKIIPRPPRFITDTLVRLQMRKGAGTAAGGGADAAGVAGGGAGAVGAAGVAGAGAADAASTAGAAAGAAVGAAGGGQNGLGVALVFGLLSGLMPCGALMAAALNAAVSGNAISGLFGMVLFALGTIPLLFAFGAGMAFIPLGWKKRVMLVLAALVLVFGLVYIDRGLRAVAPQFSSAALWAKIVGSDVPLSGGPAGTEAGEAYEVSLVIENVRYNPSRIVVPSNTPVRIVVDRREAAGCSSTLEIPELGVSEPLQDNGVTVVEVPAAPPGDYVMTCWMYMMNGTYTVQ
jgi:sulfite exporter TauE/SafE